MQKILVFGNSGSGKSTFAQKLGKKLGIKVYHLDEICLDSTWKKLPPNIIVPRVQKIMDQESWIIEGNYSSTLFLERFNEATMVITLETPVYLCVYRIFKRFLSIALNKASRIGGNEVQKNTISFKFLYWIIWAYPRTTAKRANETIKLHEKRIRSVRLRSPLEAENFIKQL